MLPSIHIADRAGCFIRVAIARRVLQPRQSTGATIGLMLACLTWLGLIGCCTGHKPATPQTATPAAVSPAKAAPAQPPAPGPAAAPAPVPPASGGISLFDGQSLKGWRVTDFAGRGDVRVDNGAIILEMGVMTGITCTNELPRLNYEVDLEASRVDGSDFFCGLTFLVGENPCSLIVGGWGGGVVGLSSLDGEDAAHNETTHYMNFEKGRWYRIRLRVTGTAIQAWIDAEKVVDIATAGRRISIRSEVELSRPLGISSWSTTAALRNIRIRRL